MVVFALVSIVIDPTVTEPTVRSTNFIASPSSHTQQFIAIMRDMLDKNKFKRPELNTFLTNKSNQKLINYHKITNNFETFHKYNILSVPSSPKEWNELVIKLRNDFKHFYAQYDIRRNKNFNKTFSEEMIGWYNEL